MKLSRELIYIALILALLMAVSFSRHRNVSARSSSAADVAYTSYNAEKHGAKALYLLLEKLGYKPRRLRMPNLTEMRVEGLAIILAPREIPISKTDAEVLLGWLRQGNALLFAPGGSEDQLAESLGVKLRPGRPVEASIAPFVFTNLNVGIEELVVKSGNRIVTKRMDTVRHFGDGDGGVVISFREEAGTAIVLSDPYLMTNAGLTEGDNLKLLVNILLSCASDAKTVYFDEYHHGFERRPTVLHLLRGTSLGWALLQIAVAVILLMYSRGQRFGRPKPVLGKEHRSSVEYVTSLAHIYQSAGASDVALSSLYERLLRFVENSASSRSIRELTEDCKRKIAEGRISEKELLDLSRRMELTRYTKEGK